MDTIDIMKNVAKNTRVYEPEGTIMVVHFTTVLVQPRGSTRYIPCEYNSSQQVAVGKRCTYTKAARKYVISKVYDAPRTVDTNNQSIAKISYGDKAIHRNIGGEILAIREKSSVDDDDVLIIEDSSDSYRKKKIKASNFSTGGGSGTKNDEQVHVDAWHTITKDGSDLVNYMRDYGESPGHFYQFDTGIMPLWVDNVLNTHAILRFDGTDDYMMKALHSDDYIVGSLALVVTFLTDNVGTVGVVQWADSLSSSSPFLMIQRDNADLRVYYGGSYQYTISHPINETHIYFFTWTLDMIELFVDGVSQSPITINPTNIGGQLWIGNGYNGYANFDLAELRIIALHGDSTLATSLTSELQTIYGL